MLRIKYLQILYYISLMLTFFTTFVIIIIPGTHANFYVCLLAWLLLYVACFFSNKKHFLDFTKLVFCQIPVKYWLIYLSYILVSTFLHILLGHYKIYPSYYIVRFKDFFIASILIYFLPILSIYLRINIIKILRFFVCMLLFVYIFGLIEYIASLYNVNLVLHIINFFTNARQSMYFDILDTIVKNRVHSLFSEPSALAQFIFIIMPLPINLFFSKYKLFENALTNLIVKKTLMPLTLILLLLTKSPIYLILCFIEFFILVVIVKFQYIKKHIIQVSCTTFILLTLLIFVSSSLLNDILINNTIFSRIQITLDCLGDFKKFSQLEISLATRIVSYVNQIKVFLENFLFGVGMYNAECYLNNKFLNSPLPLTIENYYAYYRNNLLVDLNRSLVYSTLSELGMIGFIIYNFFVIKNMIILRKIKKYYVAIEKCFVHSFYQIILMIIIISFYNLNIETPIIWIIFGFVLVFLFMLKSRRNK